jgi:hypothetical protein
MFRGISKFRKELAETARKICTPGKGILAADEVRIIIYPLTSQLVLWERNLCPSRSRIPKRTEEPTEKFYSPLQD